MHIPESHNLPTEKLGAVFNNTSATYKFYWFLAILDLVVKENKTRLSVWEIVAHMVASAWYPIHYFHLSFGKSDSMDKQIRIIHEATDMPIDMDKAEIVKHLLDENSQKEMQKIMRIFTQNVPYRFLYPWLKTTDDRLTVTLSQSTEDCLYSLTNEAEGLIININPLWIDYLTRNYNVLHDFAYWNLTLFLQVRNPNVPNIPNKLIKPIERSSLLKQHRFWDEAISEQGSIKCIYTNNDIMPGAYDLDHFIPWSFVTHDEIWNLMPADSIVNSSKNDRLPDIDKFLLPLAKAQQKAASIIFSNNPSNKLLEDYLTIVDSIDSLVNMDEDSLYDTFSKTFKPLHQIASNMNFEIWNY